jgi:hypothetical protein
MALCARGAQSLTHHGRSKRGLDGLSGNVRQTKANADIAARRKTPRSIHSREGTVVTRMMMVVTSKADNATTSEATFSNNAQVGALAQGARFARK